MLRVVTDPQPEPAGHEATAEGEPGLVDLLSSVRSLAWIVGPAAPRTFVQGEPPAEVRVVVAPGDATRLSLVLENRQQAAAPVVPLLSPLRGPGGRVWAPGVGASLVVVPPAEARPVTLEFGSAAPAEPGVYEGSIRLLGTEGGVVRVLVEVAP